MNWRTPLVWFFPVMAGLWITLATGAWAQLSRVEGAVEQVYTLIPNLPLEDSYLATGDSRGFRTLMHRVMVYHIQLMGRSPFSRLDWQLTLADYLDANEVMLAQNYPGTAVFTSNPYNGDRQVLQSLSRSQRRDLLAALLTGFGVSPEPQQPFLRENPPETLSPQDSPPASPQPFLIPPAGGADLLR